MKLLATLLLLLPLSSTAASLLILTEPTARGLAGPVFDQWVAQIVREGWTVAVREAPRRRGSDLSTNDWPLLNWMSNEVARANCDAVQLYGSLAWLKTGGAQPDGHDDRCILTHHWLGVSGLTFTDTLNWSNMVSAPIDNHIPNSIGTNAPGDGIPDQIYGTFSIPVSSIDASGLTATAGNFASGYLAGQPYQPAIDEGYWLRCYLTNNLSYRQRGWSVTETGHIDSSGWLNSAAVTATNNSVTWTVDGSSVPGATYRWVYDNQDLTLWSPDFVTAGGTWMRAFWVNTYKSYCQEDANGQGMYRRFLFPGFADRPLALMSGWSQGANSAQFFWTSRLTNATVADAIRSSAVRFGGIIPFEQPIAGDLTLPMHAVTQAAPATATVGTLTIQ